jgi:hypothetical protein
MPGQILCCAYCGEPLRLTTQGVAAWRTGNAFVCNEYCADGIAPLDPTINCPSSPGAPLTNLKAEETDAPQAMPPPGARERQRAADE